MFSILAGISHHYVVAQDNHFENGITAYERQEYDVALNNFNIAIENKYLMKGKNVPRAYSFRAQSVAKYFLEMLQTNNAKYISDHPNVLVNAFEDLDQAIRFDDGKCDALIEETKTQLLDVTFRFGQTIADSLRVDRGSNDPMTDSLVLLVIDELLILKELQDESHQINDILGLLQYKEGKISDAVSSFETSEKLYQNNPPIAPDYHHVYNYYYSALISYSEMHAFEKALREVKKARKYISDYFSRDPRAKALDAKLKSLDFQVKLLQD